MKLPLIDNYEEDTVVAFLNDNTNPSVITFISHLTNMPTTAPIWIYQYNNKFYFNSSQDTHKIRAIKSGNTKVSLAVIAKDSFPIVETSDIPYISISGTAKIVTQKENQDVAMIKKKLYEKYNAEGQADWVQARIQALEDDPDDAYIVEITPEKVYTYD